MSQELRATVEAAGEHGSFCRVVSVSEGGTRRSDCITAAAILRLLDSAAAWDEAEAALPQRWVLSLTSPDPYTSPQRYDAEAIGPGRDGYRQAWGDTKEAALQALTRALRAMPT